ncbi:YwdI family protein [Solibacillus sp. MA9]|uniref:YwdI family protein n=1 Tax=Solibacillus palustris TaxID=2908203 RepID=A0ABS9U859_9BACL|nr:YwdI family protein [Solibacillus sp. MA9]MCH7320507.1 YwdI family protein [Solibacillus sp. MA9]
MITQQTILMQIEKLTIEARQATSEQQVREKFAAIKAICDVVLAENRTEKQQSVSVTPNAMPVPAFTQPVAIPSQKLQEDDANGDSLFDF